MSDINSLAHSKWRCQYHIVFAPKYRRKIFYKEKRIETVKILWELFGWKGVTIIEAEVCPDHIHMLIRDTAKNERIKFHRIFKRKEQLNHT